MGKWGRLIRKRNQSPCYLLLLPRHSRKQEYAKKYLNLTRSTFVIFLQLRYFHDSWCSPIWLLQLNYWSWCCRCYKALCHSSWKEQDLDQIRKSSWFHLSRQVWEQHSRRHLNCLSSLEWCQYRRRKSARVLILHHWKVLDWQHGHPRNAWQKDPMENCWWPPLGRVQDL